MRILLKDVRLLDIESLVDIFIEGSKIRGIRKNIEEHDLDFKLYVDGKIATPPLTLTYREKISDIPTLSEILKSGIKGGYTTFIFPYIAEEIDLEEVEKLFNRTYAKRLSLGEGDISPLSKSKTLKVDEEASLVVWDTQRYIEGFFYIPYLVISKGKIILREGKTIFI